MTCPQCGAANEDAATACSACRTPLGVVGQGTVVASRYEIRECLGRGGMGVVYRAHDRILDETVALKVLRTDLGDREELTRRFRSEIKLARRVTHPNVCRIHEYGEDGTLRYISMELIEGTDLKQMLRVRGRLPTAEAYDVAIQIADGLQAIHRIGVVHRDLKTSNVMRDEQGVVRLMDFGIAKRFDSVTIGGGTLAGHILGTPEYMSPEQARGDKVDHRSDLYALGIVIFEIFSGDVPFRGDTPMATIFQHIEKPPPLEGSRAESIPPALAATLRRALAKAPRDRHASAEELAQELRRQNPFPHASAEATTAVSPVTVVPDSTLTAVRETVSDIPPPPPRPPRPPRATVMAPTAMRPKRSPVRGPIVGLGVILLGVAAFLIVRSPTTDVGPSPAPRASPSSPIESATAPSPASLPETPGPRLSPSPISAVTAAGSPAAVAPRSATSPPSIPVPPTPRPSAVTPAPAMPTRAAASQATPTPAPRPSAVTAHPAAPTPAATDQPAPSPTMAAPETGLLQLLVLPYAEVTLDGKPLGTTPMRPVSVEAGPHTLWFTHPDYQPMQRRIVIRRGETTRIELDLRREAFPR